MNWLDLLACLLILSGPAVASSNGTVEAAALSPEDKLLAWLESKGAKVGVTIGRTCNTCPRGLLASKDYGKGQIILAVPLNESANATILLDDVRESDGSVTIGFAAEYVRGFLKRMHRDPGFNETYGPYLATLPALGETLTPEVWPSRLLPELHTPALEAIVRSQAKYAMAVYRGSFKWRYYRPFKETVPARLLPPHMFLYWASVLGTRFVGYDLGLNKYGVTQFLVPVMDMMNHGNRPNAQRYENKTHALVQAIRRIKKGRPVVDNYVPNVVHRPDMSLVLYGFCLNLTTPLLASVDLVTYDERYPFQPTPEDDSAYDEGGAFEVSQAELARLQQLYSEAVANSSIEADEALLDGDSLTDWRHRVVVKYRWMRKRALRDTIQKLEAQVAARAAAAAAGDGAPIEAAAGGQTAANRDAAAGAAVPEESAPAEASASGAPAQWGALAGEESEEPAAGQRHEEL